jgi:hypothetical protein
MKTFTDGLYKTPIVGDAVRTMYQPRTAVERELFAECARIAVEQGTGVGCILLSAERWWETAGRQTRPTQWRSRASACRRMLDRAARWTPVNERAAALIDLRAAYAAQGLDADAEVEGIERMNAGQLRDEITYLSDFQG